MRTLNRLLALVAGLALAAAAFVAIVEMVGALTGSGDVLVPRQQWATALRQLQWDDPVLIAVAIATIVVGLALLTVALFPSRPEQLPLRGHDDAAASIDRRGLQERLRRAVVRDEDVMSASVGIRRRAKVRATVPPDADRQACRRRVRTAVETAANDVGLARPLRVHVNVTRERGRVR